MRENLEEWNWKVKCYIEDTAKALYTERDILVKQIIEVVETYAIESNTVDYDSLYDREIDEIVRVLELEHIKMQERVRERERKEKFWDEEK